MHRGIQALALCVSRLPGQSSNRSFISPTCTTPCQAHSPSLLPFSDAGMCSHTTASKRERERENIYVSQSVLLSPTVSSIRIALENEGRGGGDLKKSTLFFRPRARKTCMRARLIRKRARTGLWILFFWRCACARRTKVGFSYLVQ